MWQAFLQILPFEENFMKNAFLAILITSPMFALIGTMVVQNKMAFFSDAIGHGAFTGIAVGTLFGLSRTAFDQSTLSALLFSVIFAIIVTAVKHKTKMSADTVIGVFSSVGIALGLFIISLAGLSYNKLGSFLIGDVLSVTPEELLLLLGVLIMLIVFWLIIPNKLLLSGINNTLALSRGIRTLVTEMIFSCLVAIVVTLSISRIGILVINSYLVLPAASARNISGNMRQYSLFSVIISLVCGIVGLVAAYFLGTATGATVVLVNALVFFVTFTLKRSRG